jgi:hypothetical protein
MDLSDLLRDDPKFHFDDAGKPFSWRISDDLLKFLDQHVTREHNTLETGGGVSTVLFALKESHHTCIVPDVEEVRRIKDYCREKGLPTANIDFRIGPSQQVLPNLEGKPLDLVLIDGEHAFPLPFIDWYYTADLLKLGGCVLVDDTQIWTGNVLRDFLLAEPGWELVGKFNNRCAVFRKLVEFSPNPHWRLQPYVVRRSNSSAFSHIRRRISRAGKLARQGEFRTLFKKVLSAAQRKPQGCR